MFSNKKLLKIYGALFIFLAVLDLVTLCVSCFSGNMNFANDVQSLDGMENLLHIFTNILLAIIGIKIMIELFLGIIAIQQSEGKYKGKSHIIIARIILIVTIMLAFTTIFDIKTGNSITQKL